MDFTLDAEFMNAPGKFHPQARSAVLIVGLLAVLALAACSPMARLLLSGGEEQGRRLSRTQGGESPHVLIFALDGVGYDQMMEALRSGEKPWMSTLLGAERQGGVFEHGYAVPDAVSILPSATVPAWSSIFTGQPPARTGVPGNEWFEREGRRLLAPTPTSVQETDDARLALSDDLVGKAIQVPTLFEQVGGSSVSLNYVRRGAGLFITPSAPVLLAFAAEFKAGKFEGAASLQKNGYAELDLNSVPKVVDAINRHGVPALQVVYFPGIDLYTHLAGNPLPDQVRYLEEITFPLIETVLGEYIRKGALDDTYVIFISDHGHTPVLMDARHALGADPGTSAPGLLEALGFRVRPPHLEVSDSQSDYQAVVAYEDAMAFIYLADRSTCVGPGQTCDWIKPPRLEQDVMPVAHAFFQENQTGERFSALAGTLDLVFARKPAAVGQDAQEYEIYDGSRLVPIADYLRKHPRPDLIQLDRRMRWLSAGPYGQRAGDVLLLAKSGLGRPIADRYYFSSPYHSQHGSASQQDSHIVLILAHPGLPGEQLRERFTKIAGDKPSQLHLAPFVRMLLSMPPKRPL